MGRQTNVWVLSLILLIMPSIISFSPQIAERSTALMSGSGLSISDMQFFSERIYQESDLVYRSAAADLIPERDGNELATCSRNGKVVVTYGSRLTWESHVVHVSTIRDTANERAQVYSMDAGDVIPEHEGDELLAVDEDDSVNLIYYTQGIGWESEVIWRGVDWLYEIDIGELSGSSDQKEIVVVGEFKRATLLERSDGNWVATTIARDSEIIEACWIADILPERPGNEVILGGGRGALMVCYSDAGSWKKEDIYDFGDKNQISDLLMADIDPTIPGEEIYATTFDGMVRQVFRSGGNWTQRVIHSEGRIIYGMETGEIAGQNVLTIGTYAYRAGIIWYDDGFNFKSLYSEEYLIIGTGIFDIDPAYEGAEILSLSYLGRVVMIYRDSPGAEIILPFERTTVAPGKTVRIPFIIESRGGYDGEVQLSLENVQNEAFDVQLVSFTSSSDSISFIDITAKENGDIIEKEFTISATTPHGTFRQSLAIDVTTLYGDFNLSTSVIRNELGADRQINIGLQVGSDKGLENSLFFSTDHVPRGISVSYQRSEMEIAKGTEDQMVTLSSQGWVSPETYHFFLIAEEEETYKRAVGVELDVRTSTLSEFRLAIDPIRISVPRLSNTTVTLNMISINGYTGNVNLSVIGDHEEVEIKIRSSMVSVPSTHNIEIVIGDLQENIVIGIRGKVGDLERDAFMLIEVKPPEKDLIAKGPNTTIVLQRLENDRVSGEFRIYLEPVNGEIEDMVITIHTLSTNFTVSYLPSGLSRLFYPLNITFMIEGPIEEAPMVLVVNFSSQAEGSWEVEVPLTIENPSERGDEGGSFPWWVLLIVFTLLAGALVAYFFYRSRESNDLNEGERVQVYHEGHALPHRSSTAERTHGLGRGSGRPHYREGNNGKG